MSDGTQSSSIEETRDDMLQQFEAAQDDLADSRKYYDAERRPDAIGLAVPNNMRDLLAHVGYARVYVDSIAERQELEGFLLAQSREADSELWDWWQANNLDVEAPLGHTDALIYGRSYITISMPDPAIDLNVDPTIPMIMVEPPTSLYAMTDNRTKLVQQAIRAVYNTDGSETISCTLYLPMQTIRWVKVDGEWQPLGAPVNHGLGIVPVVPIARRTRASDLLGTSIITPEIRSVTDAAARIMMDMQATAEIMAIPQRLLFGVKPQDIGIDPDTGRKLYDAYVARILAFEDHEAKAQQFTAAELMNFVSALDALDRKAAQYTGLPPQYLAASAANPASAEAIKAAEARLVKMCERMNLIFGGAWEQAMRVAYRMAKGGDIPPQYYRMEAIWRDPSTPTYAAKADAASKLYANGTGVIPKEQARIDMGYSVETRLQMQEWDKQESAALQLAGMYGAPTGAPSTGKPAAASAPAASAAKPTATQTASPKT